MSKRICLDVPVEREAELLTFEERQEVFNNLIDTLKPYIMDEKQKDFRNKLLMTLDHYVLLKGLDQEPTRLSNII